MESVYEIVGRNLSQIRQRQGLNQTELASRIKMTRASVSQIEKGKQRVSIEVLYKMAEALEVSVHDILPPLADTDVDADTMTRLDSRAIDRVLQGIKDQILPEEDK